jgi:hypothetical protein
VPDHHFSSLTDLSTALPRLVESYFGGSTLSSVKVPLLLESSSTITYVRALGFASLVKNRWVCFVHTEPSRQAATLWLTSETES